MDLRTEKCYDSRIAFFWVVTQSHLVSSSTMIMEATGFSETLLPPMRFDGVISQHTIQIIAAMRKPKITLGILCVVF
jgi:hypothetical protein